MRFPGTPPPDGAALDVPRYDRAGAYYAVVADGRSRKNGTPPAKEDVASDADGLLAPEDLAVGPNLGYPNAVIVSEDGDRARHGDMRPKGEEVGILLVNVGSARREDYDVIAHFHTDVL